MRIDGVDIEAVYGCVPKDAVDNLSVLSELAGREKAESIVRATGFATRRIAPPGCDVFDLMLPAAQEALSGVPLDDVGGMVAVSFSGRDRFPALSARLQDALGLRSDIAAYDLSMACSGWIYGLLCAVQLVKSSGRKVLLVDGDVQSAWTDGTDVGTLAVMGDGASATLLSPGDATWEFGFLTDGSGSGALVCRDRIEMDGFGVFRFVAGPVRRFLDSFLRNSSVIGDASPVFVPHQANMYMVRQLAESLGITKWLASGRTYANTGSSSAAIALADEGVCSSADGEAPARVLLAGFGAGLSAAAAATTVGDVRRGVVLS